MVMKFPKNCHHVLNQTYEKENFNREGSHKMKINGNALKFENHTVLCLQTGTFQYFYTYRQQQHSKTISWWWYWFLKNNDNNCGGGLSFREREREHKWTPNKITSYGCKWIQGVIDINRCTKYEIKAPN